MSRSIWKGPYSYIDNKSSICNNRYSSITPNMIDTSIVLTNGKNKLTIKITKEMVGLKLGTLFRTRTKSKVKKK